jgi:hypothetical protein
MKEAVAIAKEADAVMRMPNPKVQRQANDTKEKLPIQVKTILHLSGP